MPLLQLYEGDDPFPPFPVGHADYGALLHLRPRVEDLFDLAGIDVLAAGDDYILETVDDEEVPILVENADIAQRNHPSGQKAPLVSEGLSR